MSLLEFSELDLLLKCIPNDLSVLLLGQEWAQPDANSDLVGSLEVNRVFRSRMLGALCL